mmetsp:Transcript_12892/g.35611  ORF Transcript_12892/g.35611 Transcript_12892/m.35611 type:complete len:208 (-) Transcript_12892:1081-1704(-)
MLRLHLLVCLVLIRLLLRQRARTSQVFLFHPPSLFLILLGVAHGDGAVHVEDWRLQLLQQIREEGFPGFDLCNLAFHRVHYVLAKNLVGLRRPEHSPHHFEARVPVLGLLDLSRPVFHAPRDLRRPNDERRFLLLDLLYGGRAGDPGRRGRLIRTSWCLWRRGWWYLHRRHDGGCRYGQLGELGVLSGHKRGNSFHHLSRLFRMLRT